MSSYLEHHQPLGGVSKEIEAVHMESPPIGGLSAGEVYFLIQWL